MTVAAQHRQQLFTRLKSCSLDSNHNYHLVMKEALSWVNTPWKPTGIAKTVGIDCVKFLAVCGAKYGLQVDLPIFYVQNPDKDYIKNYLNSLGKCIAFKEYGKDYGTGFNDEILKPGNYIPGTVLAFRFRGISHHVAIVAEPDKIIHASLMRKKVVLETPDKQEASRVTHCYDFGFRR